MAPTVVESYQRRLTEGSTNCWPNLSIGEVGRSGAGSGIFADRSDISEEIVRLRSHLEQFDTIAAAEESSGRKLDFVIQEMLRETNTIGSKANDAGFRGTWSRSKRRSNGCAR
jgi:uncharacterized protein (TIGR00255 family)